MHVLQGPCLNRGYARCEITEHDKFDLYLAAGKNGIIRMEVNPAAVTVEDHLVSVRSNGTSLGVVEHLFSALFGMDAFGACVVVHGSALPIFDGSAAPYAAVLQRTTCRPFERVKLDTSVLIHEKESFIQYEPADDDTLIINMGLKHPYIGEQHFSITLDRAAYRREIAPARTFVYTDDSDPRLQDLPAYGIGITETRIYSSEPLRYLDEPVRHKILDLCGDMFVLKKRLCGRIRAFNTFHALNHRFIARVAELLLHG